MHPQPFAHTSIILVCNDLLASMPADQWGSLSSHAVHTFGPVKMRFPTGVHGGETRDYIRVDAEDHPHDAEESVSSRRRRENYIPPPFPQQ